MNLKRSAAAALAVGTGVLGLTLVNAGPAAAAAGSWSAYGTTNPISSSDDLWWCTPTKEITTRVFAQNCVIRDDADHTRVRGAVIVRNNRSALYSVEAATDLQNSTLNVFYGRWECRSSGVASGTWSVCFGAWNGIAVKVVSGGGANGVALGTTIAV
jgi:hypothetical protein